MSGVIQKETAVLTLTTVDLFSDSAFLYAARNSVVSLAVEASATGTFVTIYSGGRLILEESATKVVSAAGIMPLTDQAFYYNFVAAAGERLTVSVRNPTGGTVTIFAIAQIQDL